MVSFVSLIALRNYKTIIAASLMSLAMWLYYDHDDGNFFIPIDFYYGFYSWWFPKSIFL